MVFVYRFLMQLVEVLLPLASIFSSSEKVKSFIDGRRKAIPNQSLEKKGRRYWFHCASLGEFEQAKPLMESLKELDKNNSIVITFFSPSGYTQKYKYELADTVLYLPLDTPKNAERLIHYLNPDVAIFVKYELWYFHLKSLFTNKIPVYLISAVFREGQFLFSFAGKWIFNLLPQFKQIYLQDKNSLELLKKHKLTNVVLSGDTRYDRVKQNALKVKLNESIATFKGKSQLLVLGSSWQQEEDILLQYLKENNNSELKVLLAPHDISEKHIKEIQQKFIAYNVIRYTSESDLNSAQILILDTIGHLASAYVYADAALIGGGFGKGLHNILEALAFGIPVAFGPNVEKYPEAAIAIESGVASKIENADALKHILEYYLGTEKDTTKLKCIDFINWNAGATEKIMKEVTND